MPNGLFRAAILEEQNKPLTIRALEIPKYLDVGQVMVRVKYSGVCGSQLNEIAGVKGPDKFLPHLLGHEGAGEVIAYGPGVRNIRAHDHVVIHWRKSAGIDAIYPKYWCHELNRYVGGGANTTWNEIAIISENRLTRIDKDIPLDIAALLGCAVTTGLGVVSTEAKIKIGESVVVFGCGGVGLNILQGCMLAGAYPIVGVDITEEKLRHARIFGATHVCTPEEFPNFVSNMPYDVAVDTTGKPEVITLAWKNAVRTCLVAQMHHGQVLPLQTTPMQSGNTIFGSDGGGTNPATDIPRYLKLYRAGRLNLAGLITHRYGLLQINEMLDNIRASKVGRAIIEM